MNYIVLSRKWRPKSFDQVVGQEHVTQILSNSLSINKISHSYLFSGPRGVGKTTVARILATNLNEVEDLLSSIDIIELDGASNRGIDEIRDLKESVRYVPVNGKYKIFIIDEAHMLTKEAFNALLKTLEEPPAHVIFILATTESQKIPSTISSRCQKYDFKRIRLQDIIAHLSFILKEEGYKSENEALKAIALKADGSLRDALSLLDKVIAISEKSIEYDLTASALGIVNEEIYLKLLKNITLKEIGLCLESINMVLDSGISTSNFLDGFLKYLRDCICYLALYKEDLNLSEDSLSFLKENNLGLGSLKKILELIISYNNSYKNLNSIVLENLFFKIIAFDSKEEFQKKITIKKEIESPVNHKANSSKIEDKKDEKRSLTLLEIYNKILKDLEKNDLKLYCVLEKMGVSQKDSNILQLDCRELAKYDMNLLSANLKNIKEKISSHTNIDFQIFLKDKISENILTDNEGEEKVNKNDNIKENSEPTEVKEHPLIDLAINDYKGKIIK